MNKDRSIINVWPLCMALLLIFLTLKLIGIGVVASWSWWWVLSPVLIPIAGILVYVLALLVIATASHLRRKKRMGNANRPTRISKYQKLVERMNR